MNVLSIDFDIIMYPSIEMYNPIVGGNRNVSDLQESFPLLKYIQADLIHYAKLTNYLSEIFHSQDFKDKVYFVESHEQILNFIPKEEKVDLINIDHHHDIEYNPKEENLNCGNWVKHLYLNNQLEHYKWIGNENSQTPADDNCPLAGDICPEGLYDFKAVEMNELNFTPDIICIVLSPQWVPQYYFTLFYLWMDLYGQHYDRQAHFFPLEEHT